MTSRRQSTDVPRVNFRQLAGVEERRVRGAGKAAAEEALALLLSGEAKSQAAAAAAVGHKAFKGFRAGGCWMLTPKSILKPLGNLALQ